MDNLETDNNILTIHKNLTEYFILKHRIKISL